MIKYNLKCDKDHNFDAWFSDSSNFDKQNKKKLVACPQCNSTKIEKNIMAPNIGAKKQNYTNALKTKKNVEKFLKMSKSMLRKILNMLEISLLKRQGQYIMVKKKKERFMVKPL